MRRLRVLSGVLGVFGLPGMAEACTICGEHGDTTATLFVYGAFMVIPFALFGGVVWVVRQQLRELQPAAEPGADDDVPDLLPSGAPVPTGS